MIEIEGIGEEVIVAAIVFVVSTACMGLLAFHVYMPSQVKATAKTPVATAPTRPRETQPTCPICLSDVQLACETNCGHSFCTSCLTSYFASRRVAYPCPCCRQHIHLVHTFYSPDEMSSQEGHACLLKLDQFNLRARRQAASFVQQLTDLPTLLSWAGRARSQSSLTLWSPMRMACCVVTLLYIVSPVDVIPEAAFGLFGYMDDLFLVLVILLGIASAIRDDIVHQASTRGHREVVPPLPIPSSE
ncbi:hypothetical protein H257_11542 [Aphanomyces astaci]|uniref:E3 ubiquitin-protein ligase RNF170 n=1 Tax=Aphanomyces astaci TaxID=112090 RepID=W4G2H4_APHAT|nr:hypothetical protein H257_11542 [Aphanomyces astaci]ETV73885.1 hypothetical protein H257_11542 [Aphanomyces astaci]|eukprot:XP_009836821.1 hypothetical protein H257_11542 [Aphanomyces astaci]